METIIKRAYLKAKANGYRCKWSDLEFALEKNVTYFETGQSFFGWWINKRGNKEETKWFSIFDLICNHEFAKAFWGEEKIEISIYDFEDYWTEDGQGSSGICFKQWQYHLQQMILEREPLKYLEKYL